MTSSHDPGRPEGAPHTTLLLALGFVGLAIALASIADMFSARPYDGIVPVPYGRGGIEIRMVLPGSPAERAKIRSGECIQGIGRRIVRSSSDASAELRRHKIGENVNYLVRNGPCVSPEAGPEAAAGTELRTVQLQLSSERLGGKTYLYAVVVGFLFFLIGLFVLVRVPGEPSARIFFLLCVLFLLFFVCRLRPASYWWIDIFVQNTGTVSLFLLPAVFLHFFLYFPRRKRFHFAKPDEWTGAPPPSWKVSLQDFLSASPGLLYLLYAIPPFVFLYDVFRQVQGEKVTVLSGAPLSSWILLGDYLVLGLLALAHSAFTLEDQRERRQAFHVFVGTILGTVPFVLFFIVLPSAFQIDEYVFYGIIPMILIPLTFAYAIVRFQMMNVRVIVRRTFLYAATTAVLLGLYALVVALANLVFASSRLSASPLFNFGFFLVGISLFEVLRRRLQAPLDKLFFREKFDYQTALLEMSEAITGELDLGRIADYLTASVAATMRLEKSSIWLRDREGWLERRSKRDDRLSPAAAVRRVLRQEGKPSDLEELSLHFADTESEEFRERLVSEGFRLLVPLVYRERLMGLLALKEKLSGERFDRDDLSLLSTLANQSALAIETALLHDEMTRQAELRRDLEIARDIQTSLLPRNLPEVPGFSFLGGSIPARVVGGDFYDFIPFEDGRLGVVIGDVSGKSVPASLLMVASKEIVYSRALTTSDPGVLFRESNKRIYAIKRRMFVSLGFFLLDADAMSLRYAIGGQPLPILLRVGNGGPALLEPPEHRLPLGAFRDVPYDTRELYLKKGDTLFFYTDGFTEAMDASMNPYGEERLMRSVEARNGDGTLEEVAQGVLADLRDFVGGAEQYDDMTFLFLRVE
ncbi:MAG TPA: SpoIIE family protein phosphatase [Thermoanaerobaculia bacterium]|nr:SpoIIE family protein phosphatase [Thermoanaerobaculia bacterium]